MHEFSVVDVAAEHTDDLGVGTGKHGTPVITQFDNLGLGFEVNGFTHKLGSKVLVGNGGTQLDWFLVREPVGGLGSSSGSGGDFLVFTMVGL